jgi:type II secretory pathway component PulF
MGHGHSLCLCGANILPLYYCTRALLSAPKFERIFEDMLGSKQKLPLLTNFVLEWAQPLLGLFWLLAALAVFLIFTLKRPRHVWVTATVSAFLFIASGHLVAMVLFQSLVTVIQNLSGDTGSP